MVELPDYWVVDKLRLALTATALGCRTLSMKRHKKRILYIANMKRKQCLVKISYDWNGVLFYWFTAFIFEGILFATLDGYVEDQ